jgi:hypothetical protein
MHISNCYKSLNLCNSRTIYHHFPIQGPPKHTKIGIFGMKLYHLATLHLRPNSRLLNNLHLRRLEICALGWLRV